MDRFVFNETDNKTYNTTTLPNKNSNLSGGPATESRPTDGVEKTATGSS
jgi:hypothetical protein